MKKDGGGNAYVDAEMVIINYREKILYPKHGGRRDIILDIK